MQSLIREGGVPHARACKALGLAPATAYRHEQPKPVRLGARNASHRRLSEPLRRAILSVLHSPRFCDQTPAHTYHTLLGEGTYLASIRTMQRLLKSAGEARERRPIRPRRRMRCRV